MNTQDEQAAENKKRQIKEKIMMIESIIQIFNSTISRHNRSGDPTIRATMLFDKLCMITDILTCVLTNSYMMDDVSDELKERVKLTAEKLSAELSFLQDWILTPVYSPDHPYGNNIMKESARDFSQAK